MKTINADVLKEYINNRILAFEVNIERNVGMTEELKSLLDYIDYMPNLSKEQPQESKEYFDLEKAWEQTFELYPKKLGFALAKTTYLDKLGQVVEPNRKAVASLIWRAVKRYVEDYKERNAEDVNFRYMPKFEKWLKEDCDYWIEQVRKG